MSAPLHHYDYYLSKLVLPLCAAIVCLIQFSSVHAQTSSTSKQLVARIINGQPVSEGKWPAMAYFFIVADGPDYGLFCGGTLIGPRTVVTAAHCAAFFSHAPHNVKVVVGRTRLTSSGGTTHEIAGVVLHPAFNENTSENDVALVTLTTPSTTTPIKLIEETEVALRQAGQPAVILGWGTMDLTLGVIPDRLREGSIEMVSDAYCEEQYGSPFQSTSMFCAGRLASTTTANDGVDTCYGDSGGPLLVRATDLTYRLVGITSWGAACGSAIYPGVYSRISNFISWIQSNPIAPPFLISAPEVLGILNVKQTLTCSPGVFGGGAPSSRTYQWYRNEGEIADAVEAQYLLQRSDFGNKISCSITTYNDGGSATGVSASLGPIRGALNTSANNADVTPPQSTFLGTKCVSRACFSYVAARDDQGVANVESVKSSIIRRTRSTCRKQGTSHLFSCIKNSRVTQSAVMTADKMWRFKHVRLNNPATYKLSVKARDRAGNVETPPVHYEVRAPAIRSR